MGSLLLRWAAPSVTAIAGTLVIAATAGGVAGVPEPVAVPTVPAFEPPPVSVPEVPSTPVPAPATVPAPSLPQLEPPTELDPPTQVQPVSETQAAAPIEAAESRSASPSDNGGVAQAANVSASPGPSPTEAPAPNDSASPGASPTEAASATVSVSPAPDGAGLRYRLGRSPKLQATVEELSGCLYAVSAFERRVLVLRTGLGGKQWLSRGQVARRLDATRAGVWRAERRGVRGLRQAARTDGCGESSSLDGPASAAGLAIPVLATVDRAIAGQALRALNDLDGRQLADEGGVAGFQASGVGRTASASAEDRDGSTWLLIFLSLVLGALALLGSLSTRGGGHPSVAAFLPHKPRRRRAARLSCAFCRSNRVATNPSHGLYRCVDCGFSGRLNGTPQAEAAKMRDASQRS